MRHEPNWRIPVGILGLLLGLAIYAIVIARYVPSLVMGWPVLLQTVVYLVLGSLVSHRSASLRGPSQRI